MTGAGPSYWERQRGRIQHKDFREEMDLGLMEGHMQTQHGREAEGVLCWESTDPGEEPHTYSMVFLTARGPRNYTVEFCPGRIETRT